MKKTALLSLICAVAAVHIFAAAILLFDPFSWRAAEPLPEVVVAAAQPPFAVEGFIAQSCDGIGMLSDDLELVSFGRYTGPFVEDGSNEPVTDVLAILVKNTGNQWIEYTKIDFSAGESEASFACMCLPGGAYALLLEQTRKTYDSETTYFVGSCTPSAYLQNAVMDFSADFALYPDDGVMNIQNISGENITSPVTLNYKNMRGDYFFGGIVYRIRIDAGIAADEVIQRMESNYTTLHSVILFMTYEK